MHAVLYRQNAVMYIYSSVCVWAGVCLDMSVSVCVCMSHPMILSAHCVIDMILQENKQMVMQSPNKVIACEEQKQNKQ